MLFKIGIAAVIIIATNAIASTRNSLRASFRKYSPLILRNDENFGRRQLPR